MLGFTHGDFPQGQCLGQASLSMPLSPCQVFRRQNKTASPAVRLRIIASPRHAIAGRQGQPSVHIIDYGRGGPLTISAVCIDTYIHPPGHANIPAVMQSNTALIIKSLRAAPVALGAIFPCRLWHCIGSNFNAAYQALRPSKCHIAQVAFFRSRQGKGLTIAPGALQSQNWAFWAVCRMPGGFIPCYSIKSQSRLFFSSLATGIQ